VTKQVIHHPCLKNVDVTLYIPALFHLKKIILSQEELEWKDIVAKFFYKK